MLSEARIFEARGSLKREDPCWLDDVIMEQSKPLYQGDISIAKKLTKIFDVIFRFI
jgi:hypothetical protein